MKRGKTLQGKVIVNTRATHQAAKLDVQIWACGGTPLSYPCIAIQAPDDSSAFDAAIDRLMANHYDWLVITSENTALSLQQRLQARAIDLSGGPFRVAAIGAHTAEAIGDYLALAVDLIPDEQIAEALADALLAQKAQRVLLPESAIARPTLAQRLRDGGVQVHDVTAYETVCGSGGIDMISALHNHQIHAITFTSSSTVSYFVQRWQAENPNEALAPYLTGICMAYIGPKTAATAHDHHLPVTVTATDYSLEGLMYGLVAYYHNLDL